MKKLLFISLLVVSTVRPFSLSDLWIFSSKKEQTVKTSKKTRIGIVRIDDSTRLEESSDRLYNIAKDKAIAGVLLVLDSSGGSAGEFSVVHDLIKKVSPIKPVIALVRSRALSGGYLAASAADYIIAHSYSEIGMIGVILKIQRFKNPKIVESVEADLNVEFFTDSELKSIYDPYEKELTEPVRAYLKSRTALYSNRFRTTVATNRNLDMDDAPRWSEGKVFIADEALELNLIDEIGTLFDVDEKFISLLNQRNPDINYSSEIEFV